MEQPIVDRIVRVCVPSHKSRRQQQRTALPDYPGQDRLTKGLPPLPGAEYGAFAAACHYVDGSFVEAAAESKCGKANPKTGAAFNFWHPPLVTLHLWIWYPNPTGVYGEFNPLLTPFNND